MSRRAQSMPPMLMEKPKRKPIVAVICFSWKVFTCIFSHVALVSMVVAYCIAGALIFEHLEAENEKTVKQGVRGMRANVTDDLWDMTTNFDYLRQDNWTRWVENRLEVFERDILTAMKTKGWDGNENEQQMQWTFFGALFYSIIVITTIGYGHIAPKTDMGKVITIFYAILGIPLMLLCLSNIGDVMASSFRFLYWRVCCYVCTREPKRVRRMRQSRMNMRPPPTRTRSQPPPNMRRSMRISQKSADSGFATRSDYEQNLVHSFSDPQLRHSSKHSTKKGNRSREDFKYDMHDERPRNRHDRDGRSPNSSRRPAGKGNDDDMYNSRDRRDNRYDDRRDDRYGGRSRVRERTPEEEWSDRERVRGSGRMRDYPRNYDRRASDYGYTLDPYDDVDDSPRNTGHFDRAQRFSDRGRTRERLHDRHTVERERNVRDSDRLDPVADVDSPSNHRRSQSVRSARGRSIGRDLAQGNSNTLPSAGRSKGIDLSPKSRARSVDPRAMRQSVEPDEYGIVENRYAKLVDNGNGTASKANRREKPPEKANRSYSLPRPQKNSYDRGDKRDRVDRLEVPDAVGGRRRPPEREYDDEFDEDYRMLGGRRDSHHGQMPAHLAQRRGTKVLPPSPRIMSPMGFAVHRQAKYTKSAYEDDLDYYMDSEFDSNTDLDPGNRPVPIWLCVFLVVGYIIAGAFLFSEWEHWSFLDSAYFCFITLTTIGFGDFVPAQGVKENSEVSIALCSLYLLFGISLLAMSFNLVQEEVISNVKSVARRLGILKEQDAEE